MASEERATPRFFEKSWNSLWGRDKNSSTHFTDRMEQSTNGYSVNVYEPSYGTDVSLMKLALDISLDLNPNYLTSQHEPLIADVAPMHLRNDAPSEFVNLMSTHIEFSPTADLRPPIVQPLSTGPMTVIEERNTYAEWLERELHSFGALSDTTQFAVDASAGLQNGFSPVAKLASIEISDQQQQQVRTVTRSPVNLMLMPHVPQVESPSAFDRSPPNEQLIPADVVVVPFFGGQTPRLHTTRTRYDENPSNVYYGAGYGKQFSGHENLQEHLEMHSSDKTCASSSDKNSVNNQILGNHTGEKKFTCDICQKKFTRQDSLQGHKAIHNNEKVFACPICGKKFARNGYLKKHMVIHTEEKKFACDVCNKEFARHVDLKYHMTIHTGDKMFACKICDKKFARDSNLRDHMAVHNEKKMFTCEICGKKFTCDSYLRHHLKVHNREKKFTCDVCSKEFAYCTDLEVHRIIHAGDKMFACKICDKNFAHVRYLTQHMKVHIEEKKFGCDVCGKIFASKENLKIHAIVHTKEKKFACDVCNMRFGQKGSLIRHRAIHTGVQKFACEICNKEIARYDNFLVHLRTHEKSQL